MWFEQLTGFHEQFPEQVRALLHYSDNQITSTLNGKSYVVGAFSQPSLAALRAEAAACRSTEGRSSMTLTEIVSNVADLHASPENTNALFQVASQFNFLEMVSPDVTPERGVGIYQYDHTQGPACAIAAGAGTIFRNYFVEMPGGARGQSATAQLDGLSELGHVLGNHDARLWQMRNGYALASHKGLLEINARLQAMSELEREALSGLLRVGLQSQTQVTLPQIVSMQPPQLVSQLYCSALPVAYSLHPSALWQPFATLILEAAYEASVCAAIINRAKTGNPRLYLTLLGGGAFGNQTSWIVSAMQRAFRRYRTAEIEVIIVSYGGSKAFVQALIAEFSSSR